MGGGVEDWSPVESGAGAIAPSRPLPHVQLHSTATSINPAAGKTSGSTPLSSRHTKTKKKNKNLAQMTEHFKAPEKIQLSEEEIDLSLIHISEPTRRCD